MGNHLQMRNVPLPCLITGGYIYFHPGQLTFPGKLRTKTEHIPIRRPLQLNESHVFPMFSQLPPKKDIIKALHLPKIQFLNYTPWPIWGFPSHVW